MAGPAESSDTLGSVTGVNGLTAGPDGRSRMPLQTALCPAPLHLSPEDSGFPQCLLPGASLPALPLPQGLHPTAAHHGVYLVQTKPSGDAVFHFPQRKTCLVCPSLPPPGRPLGLWVVLPASHGPHTCSSCLGFSGCAAQLSSCSCWVQVPASWVSHLDPSVVAICFLGVPQGGLSVKFVKILACLKMALFYSHHGFQVQYFALACWRHCPVVLHHPTLPLRGLCPLVLFCVT